MNSAMLILTYWPDQSSLWPLLSLTTRVYFLGLLAVAAHTLYFFVRTMVRLRNTRIKSVSATRLAEIVPGVETLRQLHGFMLLLFGVCCASETLGAIRAVELSKMSLSSVGIEVYAPVAAFACVVLAILLFLHALQWAVAIRLRTRIAEDQ
jgi:hypothetical protein